MKTTSKGNTQIRVGQKACKSQAMLDITKECGKGKFFTQNFLYLESAIKNLNPYYE